MESTWDKPQELVDWEAKIAALQNPTSSEPEPSKVNGAVVTETPGEVKSESEEEEEDQVRRIGCLLEASLCVYQYVQPCLSIKMR